MADDREVANQRRKIGTIMIGGALAVIGLSGITLIGGVGWYLSALAERSGPLSEDDFRTAFDYVDRFIAQILPLFGAWVGAVIAFYFARDNFDAATENTRSLLQSMGATDLEAIAAREAMIPVSSVTAACTPREDQLKVLKDIMPRFEQKGLGRIVILDANNHGRGVLHESYVKEFLLRPPAPAPQAADAISLADLLGHPRTVEQLEKSAVFVRPDTTLAQVRAEMEKASRGAPRTIRDCFVTPGGRPDEAIVGYLSDLDIAKKAKLGG